MAPARRTGTGEGFPSRNRFLLGAVYGGAMALVYGVLGLVVIPHRQHVRHHQFVAVVQLGIAILSRRARARHAFDVLIIDFSSLSTRWFTPSARSGTFVTGVQHGRCSRPPRWRARASRLLSSRSFCFRATRWRPGPGSRSRCCSVSASRKRFRRPIVGAGLAVLPKPGNWMVRVGRGVRRLIMATASLRLPEAYRSANRWVDLAAVASEQQDRPEGRAARLARRGLDRRNARAEAGPRRPVGDLVRTA